MTDVALPQAGQPRAGSPRRPAGRGPGARGRGALARRSAARLPLDLALPRAGVRGGRRLHRPGQLRDEHRGRREVRLPAAVGDPLLEPDGDAHPDDEREARHRDRDEPAGGLPRALQPPGVDRPLGAGRGDRDGHRPRRVHRRRARAQPALRDRPVLGRGADRDHRVRDPGAADALRLPPSRGGHRRACRRHHRGVRLPGLPRRPLGLRHREGPVHPQFARHGEHSDRGLGSLARR